MIFKNIYRESIVKIMQTVFETGNMMLKKISQHENVRI